MVLCTNTEAEAKRLLNFIKNSAKSQNCIHFKN